MLSVAYFQYNIFCLIPTLYSIVQIRAIPFGNDGRLWMEPIDIALINPNGDLMRKWNARNAASTGGPITVNFPLDKPTICGKWTGSENFILA